MADPSELSDEQILKKVIGQPETAQIAESLGMSVEDYAKKVLTYVRNPDKEPVLEIMSDEAAREAGMPSPEECAEFLEKVVDDLNAAEKARFAGFDEDEKSAATASGTGALRKKAPKTGEAAGKIVVADEQTDVGRMLKQQVADAKRKATVEAEKRRGERRDESSAPRKRR